MEKPANSRLASTLGMNAIILAAGVGRRMAKMGRKEPKCLLQFGSKTLLSHSLTALANRGVAEITVVIGYEKEAVLDAVRKQSFESHHSHLQMQIPAVNFVHNPDFATTNTLYSLWLARESLRGDTILLNGDVLFDPRILDLLTGLSQTALAIDPHACGPEEVKIMIDETSRIRRIGKEISPMEASGEYVGIARLNSSGAMALRTSLHELMDRLSNCPNESGDLAQDRQSAQLFYEAALNEILASKEILAVHISGMSAIEIDTPEDYDFARRLWDDGAFGI